MGQCQERSVGVTTSYWDEVDFELPSVNEAKASSESFVDEVDDGTYQVQIIDISPRLENKFNENRDRRALTFLIVADLLEPGSENVGKRFRQYYNISTHPKGAMYPLFKAAAGGVLDPDVRPKLTDLRDAQVKGSLITKPKENGTGDQQLLEGLMPAKKRVEPPPF